MNPNDNAEQSKLGWLDRIKGMFIFDNLDPAPNPISAPVLNEPVIPAAPTTTVADNSLPQTNIILEPSTTAEFPTPSQSPQPAISAIPEAPQPMPTSTNSTFQTNPPVAPTTPLTSFGAGIDPKDPFVDINPTPTTNPVTESSAMPSLDNMPTENPILNQTPAEQPTSFTTGPQPIADTEPATTLPNIPSAGGANTTETPPLVPSAEPGLSPAQQPATQEPQKVESIGIPFDQVKWS